MTFSANTHLHKQPEKPCGDWAQNPALCVSLSLTGVAREPRHCLRITWPAVHSLRHLSSFADQRSECYICRDFLGSTPKQSSRRSQIVREGAHRRRLQGKVQSSARTGRVVGQVELKILQALHVIVGLREAAPARSGLRRSVNARAGNASLHLCPGLASYHFP